MRIEILDLRFEKRQLGLNLKSIILCLKSNLLEAKRG